MKQKIAIAAACITLLIAATIFAAWTMLRRSSNAAILGENTPPLSVNEYREAVTKFTTIVADQDPRIALDSFRQAIEADPRLARDCHSIAHEIGHAAFKKYGNFAAAMQYQDEVCNSGYMHGVIEGFLKSAPADIAVTAKNLCAPNASDTLAAIVQCYHGLGHAFMYSTSNDLPRSISLCHAFDNAFFVHTCTGGAFMENFNTDTEKTGHITEYEDSKNPFYPCPTEDPTDKPSCYTYAPTYFLLLHNDNYADAFSWCGTVEAGYREQCAGGVGYRAMNENIDNPMFVEKICDIPSIKMGESCIFAATVVYIDHTGSTGPARTFCGRLEAWSQPDCLRAVYDMGLLLKTPSTM